MWSHSICSIVLFPELFLWNYRLECSSYFSPISFCGNCIGSIFFSYYRQPVCSVLKNLFCEAYQKRGTRDMELRTRDPRPAANDPSPETRDPEPICGTRDLGLLRRTQDLGPSTWDSFWNIHTPILVICHM